MKFQSDTFCAASAVCRFGWSSAAQTEIKIATALALLPATRASRRRSSEESRAGETGDSSRSQTLPSRVLGGRTRESAFEGLHHFRWHSSSSANDRNSHVGSDWANFSAVHPARLWTFADS